MVKLPERLPEDIEAERSLLATCCAPGMETRAVEVFARLEPRDFIAPQHRALFEAASAMAFRGDEVNALTLRDELDRRRTLGSLGGFAGLTELLGASEVGRPEKLADILIRKRQARELIKLGAELVREAGEEVQDPVDIARRCAQVALQAAEGPRAGLRGPVPAGEALTGFLCDREDGVAVGVPTGLRWFDELTGGLAPGQLIVVAARPGMGKTALTLGWAHHVAQAQVRAAYWSLEMGTAELNERLLAQADYLPMGWLKRPHLPDQELARVLAGRDYLSTLPLDLCDDAKVSPAMIRAALAKAMVRGRPYGAAFVDHLGLLQSDDPDAGRKNEATRLGAITRDLKLMAKEFQLPIVLLSQLNRDLEHGNGRKPRLSDLRDSGSIEQDADVVVFVHRPMEGGVPQPLGEMLVPKQRSGQTGAQAIRFQGERQRFLEVERTTSDHGNAGGPLL